MHIMDYYRLDVAGIEGTNAYCSEESARVIRKEIARIPLGAVHDIGNGNYHYLSLFFLERIETPFALILFDHHPDNQDDAFGSGLLSCGNWVAEASSKLPFLKCVRWIGGKSEPAEIQEDIPVYISIDLDVLDKRCIQTIWDQGEMTPDELKDELLTIFRSRKVIGVDICGSPDSSDAVLNDIISFLEGFQSSPAT